MNILYITHCDPRATDSGSAQRSNHLWKALKSVGTVFTVFNASAKIPLIYDEADRICSATLAPEGWVRLHIFARFNSLFSPFVWPFRSRRVLLRKMPWKDVSFDIVVVRYLGNVALTNAWMFGDVYVDIDDLPSESFNTIRRGRLKPPFKWLGDRLVSWWQRYILTKCKASWIANPDQVPLVATICRCEALPNIPLPAPAGYRICGGQRRQIMSVGLMNYEPNYEGVNWFVDNVWPGIHARNPDLEYKICGGGTPGWLARKWNTVPGVEVMGFVADIDKVYEESIAAITPILSGAGTCIKVLEAALRGRKVFATPFAVRGLSEECISCLGIEASSFAVEIADRLSAWVAKSTAERDAAQCEIAADGGKLFSYDGFSAAVRKMLAQ